MRCRSITGMLGCIHSRAWPWFNYQRIYMPYLGNVYLSLSSLVSITCSCNSAFICLHVPFLMASLCLFVQKEFSTLLLNEFCVQWTPWFWEKEREISCFFPFSKTVAKSLTVRLGAILVWVCHLRWAKAAII